MEEHRQRDGAPSRLDDLGTYIRHQRESARLSLRKLASLAGVSNPYLSQIERGLRKPSAEILQAIAKALEISSETLYVKAGILEEREATEDVPTVIARDPHLTGPQRQALLEMYRSFRQLTELNAERLDPAGAGSGRGAGEAEDDTDADPTRVAASAVTDGPDTDRSDTDGADTDRSDTAGRTEREEPGERPSRRGRLLDRVTMGGLDDEAVRAASHPAEDPEIA